MQVAPFQRSRTLRADRGVARGHVVHQHKLHFVNGHLADPYLAVRLRALVPSLTLGSCFIHTLTNIENQNNWGAGEAVSHRTRMHNRSRYSTSSSWQIGIRSCRSSRL